MVKNLPANAGDVRNVGLISGLGRSLGVENGNPLQYSCQKIPRAGEPGGLHTVCGAAELDTTEHMGRGAFMMMSIVETNRAVQIYPMLLCGGKGIWSGAREGERIRKVKMAEEVQDQVYPSRDICKNESMCDQGQVNLI